jgi:hypothetical protein
MLRNDNKMPGKLRDVGGVWYGSHMNTNGNCQTLDLDTVDKMFFTTPARGQKAIDAYCAGCPMSEECLAVTQEIEKPFGVFGGRWFG